MENEFQMQAVESSNIAAVGYNKPTKTLRIEFTNGSVYDYAGVSPQQHEALMGSESKGQFLNMAIKSQFPYTRVL
jgi:hypothetical protein